MKGKVSIGKDVPLDLYTIFKKESELAVDTELHGLSPVRDRVVLLIIGDGNGNIALVQTTGIKSLPQRAKDLLTNKKILKIAHFALVDYSMIKASFGIDMLPVFCTKVASKLVRTYTGWHGLKNLSTELLGIKLDKKHTETDWSSKKLTPGQLDYAADDGRHLVAIRKKLLQMINSRGKLPNLNITLKELNDRCQQHIPLMADLVLGGYGEGDFGWEIKIFQH